MTRSLELDTMEIAELMFRKIGHGERFPSYFDYFMNSPPDHRTYVFRGPDWMIWLQHQTPQDNPQLPDDAWFVFYFHNRSMPLSYFFNLFPYPLPYVAYERGVRGKTNLTIMKYEAIRKKCAEHSISFRGL